jgi:hypothetical protein
VKKSAFSWSELDQPSLLIAICIVLLSFIVYSPFLAVPFLPDDYLQITLARDWGPINHWRYLFADPLFRNRATSIIMTYWTDVLFPLSELACGISSIALHALNGLLVYGLGKARSLGWRLSGLAAIIFVLQERPHEAVIWYASLPELLVFAFVLTTLLLWIRWLDSGSRSIALFPAMVASFVLALLSKESAVVTIPLMLLIALSEKFPLGRILWRLLPFVVIGMFYVIWVFQGQQQNHHFHDGTFAMQLGFFKAAVLSTGRGLWVWGWVALIFVLASKTRSFGLLLGSLAWMFLSLLPYSFLTYMATVPSRHHYLAAVGCSLIVAVGVRTLAEQIRRPHVAFWCILVIGIHHTAYLWTAKYRQFERRSQPIEAFIHFLNRETRRPIVVHCSDYLFLEAQRAAHLRLGESVQNLVFEISAKDSDSPSYCLPKL